MLSMMFGSSLPNVPWMDHVKSEAQFENMVQFVEMFNRYSNIAITRFKWEGLPESVSERFLNIALYMYGKAAMFEDENLGLLVLPYTNNGEWNFYYEPTRIRPFSINYTSQKTYNRGEFVDIRNTPTYTPTAFPVFQYTKRLSDILRTIDVVLLHKKRPYGILADERERLTIMNTIKKVADNEPLIIGAKNFDRGRDSNRVLDVVNMEDKTDIRELWETFQSILSYLYTMLGIENSNFEKRERLLVDEVNSNNMVTEINTEVQLKEYERACDEMNKMFGLNVSVSVKTQADYRREIMKGEESDGAVYD